MPLTLKPFTVKDISLTLVKTADIGTALEEEYKCQLSTATLVPSAGGGTTSESLETFCETFSTAGSSLAVWNLSLGGFQAVESVEDFTIMSFNNEGENYTFSLVPNKASAGVSATSPAFTGEVTMVATQIGGAVSTFAQFTVDLPVVGKPVMQTLI